MAHIAYQNVDIANSYNIHKTDLKNIVLKKSLSCLNEALNENLFLAYRISKIQNFCNFFIFSITFHLFILEKFQNFIQKDNFDFFHWFSQYFEN